jgi:RNA recognition motif-containing protein
VLGQVYIGNLSFRAIEADLVDFFGSPETITDVRVQRDQMTDRPKGFAYVEFRDRDALVQALTLDGQVRIRFSFICHRMRERSRNLERDFTEP